MKSIGNYGIGGSNIILRNRQLNFVNLVATITDTRVHEDTLILVYYSEATQAAAQAAGITTETNEGNITFTAANPPSSTIVCDVVLLSANMISQMASASDIDYSNAQSGLTSTDVQGAVDEVAEKIAEKKLIKVSGTDISDLSTKWSMLTTQQKDRCIEMKVNGNYMDHYTYNVFRGVVQLSSTTSKITQEVLIIGSSPTYGTTEYTLGQSSAVSSILTVTSWEFTYIEM